jgi:hypothetical protein
MIAKVAYLIPLATIFPLAAAQPHGALLEPNANIVTVAFVSRCEGEGSEKLDLEAAEMLAELIGAPVFAFGGREIGTAADISFDDQGRPKWLLITTEANIGLGTRTVNVPRGTFMVLRGAVVLDWTPEQLRLLPDAEDYKL